MPTLSLAAAHPPTEASATHFSCAVQGVSSSRSFHLTLNIKVSAFTQQVVPEP